MYYQYKEEIFIFTLLWTDMATQERKAKSALDWSQRPKIYPSLTDDLNGIKLPALQ